MADLEYAYDNWIVRVGDDLVEVFNRSIIGTFRAPLKWAGVQTEPRKDGSLRVHFGLLPADPAPLDSPSLISGGPWMITVAPDAVPAMREFLTALAAKAGRQG